VDFVVHRHFLCNDDISRILVGLVELVAADVAESKPDHTDAEVHHEAGHEEMHHQATKRMLWQNFSALLRNLLGVLHEAPRDEERMVVLRAELYAVIMAHHLHMAHAVRAMVFSTFFNFFILVPRWGWGEKTGEKRGKGAVFLVL